MQEGVTLSRCGRHGLDPSTDLPCIFTNGAICGEYTHARHVADAAFTPQIRLSVKRVSPRLSGNVGGEIRQQHVMVAAPTAASPSGGGSGSARSVRTAPSDGVQHGFEGRLAFKITHGLVAALPQCTDFWRLQAKDEDVVVANVLANFDVGTIVGANGQCAIEGQLHVAGAGGFGAGS